MQKKAAEKKRKAQLEAVKKRRQKKDEALKKLAEQQEAKNNQQYNPELFSDPTSDPYVVFTIECAAPLPRLGLAAR